MSQTSSVYREVLLEHFRHPRNRGGLEAMRHVHRGANPRCGDEIEVGVDIDEQCLRVVRFRGRGCSICIASASMMSEVLTGSTLDEARSLAGVLIGWFSEASRETPPPISEPLTALGAVREHPARWRCVLLPWEALLGSLAQAH